MTIFQNLSTTLIQFILSLLHNYQISSNSPLSWIFLDGKSSNFNPYFIPLVFVLFISVCGIIFGLLLMYLDEVLVLKYF